MSHKLTHSEFLDRISLYIKDNYKILNTYKTSRDPILLEDNLGIIYSKKPFELFTKKKVSILSAINKTDAMIKIIESIHGKGTYKIYGKYITERTPIIVEDYLGIKYKSNLDDLKSGRKPSILTALNKNDAFIKLSKNIHVNLYDYSKSIYKDTDTKVIITCAVHGDFLQTPAAHYTGQGCPKCGTANAAKAHTKENKVFIEECNKIHNNKYNYSEVNYKTSRHKIKVICKVHGKFYPIANNHLKGSGCPKCARERDTHLGYNKSNWKKLYDKAIGEKQPIVYIIQAYDKDTREKFIKIGRTFRSIKTRLGTNPHKDFPYYYDILAVIKGDIDFIFGLEKKLHSDFKNYKYEPNKIFKGMHECFSLEILKELNYETK